MEQPRRVTAGHFVVDTHCSYCDTSGRGMSVKSDDRVSIKLVALSRMVSHFKVFLDLQLSRSESIPFHS